MAPLPHSPAKAFQAALDLFETGVTLMRQNLRREYPAATPAEVERRLADWLRTRPGAEFGDSAGRPLDLNRLRP